MTKYRITCNFCRIKGYIERECDLKSMFNKMEDWKSRMTEQRRRTYHAHSIEGTSHQLEHINVMHNESKHFHYNIDDNYDGNLALDEINACIVDINTLKINSTDVPSYLDSGTTHHVSGN